jgi:hypothetical protein
MGPEDLVKMIECYHHIIMPHRPQWRGTLPQEKAQPADMALQDQLQSDLDEAPQQPSQLQRAASDMQPSGRRRGREAQRQEGITDQPPLKRRNPRRAGKKLTDPRSLAHDDVACQISVQGDYGYCSLVSILTRFPAGIVLIMRS